MPPVTIPVHLAERDAIYAEAHLVVDSLDGPLQYMVDSILKDPGTRSHDAWCFWCGLKSVILS